jgi:hypothetical protein
MDLEGVRRLRMRLIGPKGSGGDCAALAAVGSRAVSGVGDVDQGRVGSPGMLDIRR